MAFFLLIFVIVGVALYVQLYSKIQSLERDLRNLTSGRQSAKPPASASLEAPVIRQVVPAMNQQHGERLANVGAPASVKESHDLEFKFGGKAFTIIGAIAVVLGVGFFLRYAFDRNLITELTRMILGIIAGLVLASIGVWQRNRHAWYGSVLVGGGLGLCYLSVYAGFAFYGILGSAVALSLLILISLLAVAFAWRYGSPVLAIIAEIGAFLAPLLLGSQAMRLHQLFPYIIIINLGLLALAWRKSWQFLSYIAFGATVIISLVWFTRFYGSTLYYTPTLIYVSILFVIFIASSIVRLMRRATNAEGELVFTFIVSLFYFLTGYFMTRAAYFDSRGLFVLILAIVYLLSAGLVYYLRRPGSVLCQQVLIGLGFIFLVIFAPIQLGASWVSIAWSAEALVLFLLSLQLSSSGLRFVSIFLFQLAMLRLFVWDGPLSGAHAAWLNDRTLPFIISTILFVVSFLVARANERLREAKQGWVSYLLSINIFLIIVYWLSVEVIDFYPTYWLPIIWSILAAAGIQLAIHDRNTPLRITSYIFLVMSGFRLLVADGRSLGDEFTLIVNHRVLVFLIVLASTSYAVQLIRRSYLSESEKKAFGIITFSSAQVLTLYLIGREVYDYYGAKELAALSSGNYSGGYDGGAPSYANIKRSILSVSWAIYAVAILIFGIIRRSAVARTGAISVLGLVILKVFLFDTAFLNNFYRFISFITLGVLLLVTGYLYHRYGDRIRSFITAR